MKNPHARLSRAGTVLISFAFSCSIALAGQTTMIYQPSSLTAGPFPSDVLTTPDSTQSTGHRIDLPPNADSCDPAMSRAVCTNREALNQLDGFSVNPRLMVCFSAPVDTTTLTAGVSLYAAGSSTAIPVNQVIFDPATNCAFAKPGQVLNQRSAYALVVTDSLHDSSGNKMKADGAFSSCIGSNDPYCAALTDAISNVPQQPASANKIIGASLFTTLSATTWLEGARGFVEANEPPFVLPAGLISLFPLFTVKSMTWNPANSGLPPQPIPLSALSNVGAVGFGLFYSPNYLNISGNAPGTITTSPGNPISVPGVSPGFAPGFIPVSFHIFLPQGLPPLGGFPVAIYGHGLGDSQFGAPTYIANTLAQSGIATVAFEIQGNGYGASSTVQVTDMWNNNYTVNTPGRGVQLGSGNIGDADGCIVGGAIGIRDCARQTAVDLFALTEAIEKTAGLGFSVNPGRIYYIGQSFGSTYGALYHAVDPNVKAAVINAGGGSTVDLSRLAITARPLGVQFLAPYGLLNVPPAPPQPYFRDVPIDALFNDEYVYRDQPAVTDSIPGALKTQAAFEAADWLGMIGDPLAYAPHFKNSPLAGVPPKATLFQFAYGDLEVPNPTESALVLAAGAQTTTSYLRFDLAVQTQPALLRATFPVGNTMPSLPHAILSNPDIFASGEPWNPAQTSLALAEQKQVAGFFSSGGANIPDANTFLIGGPFSGQHLFEIPSVLPEALNFLQFPY